MVTSQAVQVPTVRVTVPTTSISNSVMTVDEGRTVEGKCG
jgi:hypothetical protein